MSQAIQGDRPARRSQAARTAETRAKILEAVVECIAEVGFQRTTAAEITRRAGVTWGAVQHQFGDKDGILRAVLQESFDRFAERLADVPGPDAALEDRVAAFVDRAWEHFGSDDYRSTFEILLSLDAPADGGPEPVWQGEIMNAWSAIWSSKGEAVSSGLVNQLHGVGQFGMSFGYGMVLLFTQRTFYPASKSAAVTTWTVVAILTTTLVGRTFYEGFAISLEPGPLHWAGYYCRMFALVWAAGAAFSYSGSSTTAPATTTSDSWTTTAPSTTLRTTSARPASTATSARFAC